MKRTRRVKIKRRYTKRSRRKQRGGGKTLEEIIAELKEKGKYEEWKAKGSKFTYKSSKIRFPMIHTFIDMDGNPIAGHMQGEYISEFEENIPIFGAILKEKGPGDVGPKEYKIIGVDGELRTTGLGTCSSLSMIVGTQKFLAHLDAQTDIAPMILRLLELIKTEGATPTNIKIYPGTLNSTITKQLAENIISGIGADLKKVREIQTSAKNPTYEVKC